MLIVLLGWMLLTEKYEKAWKRELPKCFNIKLPNRSVNIEKEPTVMFRQVYIIGITSKGKFLVTDHLEDYYANYFSIDPNYIITLRLFEREGKKKGGFVSSFKNLRIGDRVSPTITKSYADTFVLKRKSPYKIAAEEKRKKSLEDEKKFKRNRDKKQKTLKEKFRKERQDYLDGMKKKNPELYKKEMKIGNQYDENQKRK